MRKIIVYGPGCAKCKETEQRVRHVIEASGVEANITKAVDFAEIAKAGVLATPAIGIDGIIKLSGRVPTEDEIKSWMIES